MDQTVALPACVASFAPRDPADARRLVALVPEKATAVEMRLDHWREAGSVEELLSIGPRPVIVTYRTRAQGGDFAGSSEEYRRLVAGAHAAGATVDVEHASGLLDDPTQLADRGRVIVSHHSPFSIPEDWRDRLAAMLACRARAVKFVCGAPDLAASLELAAIQTKYRGDSVAAFPMGPASPPGRVLSALSGAALVYGPVETPTASGQIPMRELLETYAVDRPRPIAALYGIVGSDVAGSLSPALHNALFRSRELPSLYLPLPVADWERSDPTRLAFDPAFRGFSVTQPWKLAAASAGRASDEVRETEAANTLWKSGALWRSGNTDVDAIFDPLADHDTGEGRTAVVLGTGGAARAAIVATRRLGYEVLVCGRRDVAADALAEKFRVDSLAHEDLGQTEADLYVNATPLGARPDDPPAFPRSVLENRPLVFDCVYRRDGSATSTVAAARAASCPTVDGIQMFAAQAVSQARLFGVEDASLEEVERLLREAR
ncbi:MAG TPA: type I 3-dehydroquinate dehydratase [Thermoanaerobaculia bacterium]|nr:type I 3-dehydroquinate dehydratase [Thermoanaerobaculia bacterium]